MEEVTVSVIVALRRKATLADHLSFVVLMLAADPKVYSSLSLRTNTGPLVRPPGPGTHTPHDPTSSCAFADQE